MSAALRPVLSLIVASADPVVPDQDAPDGKERSLGNVFQRQTSGLQGVPCDPHRFRVVFPDQWMAFLRAHHRSAEEVAVFYGVTFRTAENWWHGLNAGSGAAVALAALSHPAAFASHFSDTRAA
jgi:hypothetical protein